MRSGIELLLVTKEQATVNAVECVLVESVVEESKDFTLAGVYQDLSQVRSCLSDRKAQVIIVDIDPDPDKILRDVRTICDIAPSTPVVIVSSSLTKELVLQAMRTGAKHFLDKKTLGAELLEGLQTLIVDNRKSQTSSNSRVIPVFSASGGCGATTVAINLASELRLLSPRGILAIDLDGCYGAVSSYLGIESQYGIADVLTPKKNVIDEHLIRSSAYTYREDFHVLTSPASAKSPGSRLLQYENLPRALEACRQVYEYTVIDAPRLPQTAAVELGKLSDIVVIVFQLTVKDVSTTRSIVSSLTESGIARERIIPLANRVKKRGPLVRFEDTKRALGLSSCISIRSDWRKAMKSINHARPLAEAVRRSGLRRDIRELAVNVRARRKNGAVKV
ncbi:MAG: AAA family ATPase [Planctomycetota bacterium]|jgi:pilus assembly protein CpaE